MSGDTAEGDPVRNAGPKKGEEGIQPRQRWANNREFILALVGEVFSLEAVWRFPYLCSINGGVVFFIPYFILLFCFGIPVFFLETALGQYTSEGGITAWRKICPMLEGLGIASQVLVTFHNIYYIVMLAWAILYLIFSFQTPLPWSTCDNVWNTVLCYNHISAFANPHMFRPGSNWSFLNNVTTIDFTASVGYENSTALFSMEKSSEMEFWFNRVLRISDDMTLYHVSWELASSLLLAWVLCYFCIWKGIKWMGKIVYFTATFPYLILIILFISGVTLPGAAEGIKFYLYPEFRKLVYPTVWFHAASQVLISCVLCKGVLTTLGSYNKYNSNCYRDCWLLCAVNSATTIFTAFVVFSVLGFMAHELGEAETNLIASGPNLVFIIFVGAVSLLPVPKFWAVLVFLLFLFVSLDNQFVCVDSLATTITDLFPHHLRRRGHREILVLVIAVICFLLGLPFLTEGGLLLFHVIDTFALSEISFFTIALLETIAIGWVYGADRFYDNIEDMIGYRPFPVLKYCWMFITPLICGLKLLENITEMETIYLNGYVPGYWCKLLSTLLMAAPLLCIPISVLVAVVRDSQDMALPSKELRQARPHKPRLTLCKRVIIRAQGLSP
uniref:Transporter n=1 Tax=Echeneis naucrates TaxID=173247 RepID=A0A665VWU9_ECHNA